jgi:GTP-binding protein
MLNAEFIGSAVKKEQYPEDMLPELVLLGRSNVGKSTFINTVLNRKSLARVGSTPGKTRLINFFLVNKLFFFVDLPGYGYAKVSKEEQLGWKKIIENYLYNREHIKMYILILDSRHKPNENDILMFNWILHTGLSYLVIANKADKLSKNELSNNVNIIKNTFKMVNTDFIIPFSSKTKLGKDKSIELIEKYILL